MQQKTTEDYLKIENYFLEIEQTQNTAKSLHLKISVNKLINNSVGNMWSPWSL